MVDCDAIRYASKLDEGKLKAVERVQQRSTRSSEPRAMTDGPAEPVLKPILKITLSREVTGTLPLSK